MSRRECVSRQSVALDALVAGCFVAIDTLVTLVGASWWPAHPGKLAWTLLVLQGVADASLVARRRAPMLVIAILTGFTLVLSLLISPAGALTPAHAGNLWAPYGTVVAAYGPFYYRRCQEAAFAAVGTMTLIVGRIWEPSVSLMLFAVLRTAVGPLLALYYTARNGMIQALRDRADRAEREQHLLAEQARAEERARLAGEMHDVVTHRVSLMVLQAGALGITATDAATRQAAEELRAAGVQALDELRDLVGILRTEPQPEQAPASPGLAELVAESTSVGTPAELAVEGDATLASPVVSRTAYLIVREALTNVRKHAPGARVAVQIHYGESQVRLVVRNSAMAAPLDSSLAGTGSGLGLASLRQRIELVHGTLRAGGTPDGGFCLEATMPSFVPTAEPAAGPVVRP